MYRKKLYNVNFYAYSKIIEINEVVVLVNNFLEL